MDSSTATPKKSKTPKNVTFKEDEMKAHKKKKSSKPEKSKKEHKSKKAEAEVDVFSTSSKKRKAQEEAEEKEGKKANLEVNTLLRLCEWLTALQIPHDEDALNVLRKKKPDAYHQLFRIMGEQAEKGLIYVFSIKSNVGRMFKYDKEEDIFKCARDHVNLIRLTQYDTKESLNLPVIKEGLTPEQKEAVFDWLGVTQAEEETLKPEKWLYALIETKVIIPRDLKPSYMDQLGLCLIHDVDRQETHWAGSDLGKSKLLRSIVTRTRFINEKNVEAECVALLKKRNEIVAYLRKILATPPQAPLKKQKKEPISVPEPKKKQKPQKQQAKVEEVFSESSESTSSSSSWSMSEEEQQQLQQQPPTKKQKPITPIQPEPTSFTDALEYKKIMMHCAKSKKLVEEKFNPELEWFRANCK